MSRRKSDRFKRWFKRHTRKKIKWVTYRNIPRMPNSTSDRYGRWFKRHTKREMLYDYLTKDKYYLKTIEAENTKNEDETGKNSLKTKTVEVSRECEKKVKRNCDSTFHMSELISREGNHVLDPRFYITCMCGDIIPSYKCHTHYTEICSHINKRTNVIRCRCRRIISFYEARLHYVECTAFYNIDINVITCICGDTMSFDGARNHYITCSSMST